VQDHNESTGKKEEVRVQKDDESTDEEGDYSTIGRIPLLFRAIRLGDSY
jgi:hypothetical protein